MRCYLFFIVMLLLSDLAIAQQPYYYKIDSENGFQSNEVYEIEQDSFGFLWIGCDAGVFRFDGVEFKQYIHPQQNSRSISHIIIDEKQRVWCQNFSGQIFYIYQDSIHLFKDFSKESSTFPRYAIFDNQLFKSSSQDIDVYNIDSKIVEDTYWNKVENEEGTFGVIHLAVGINGFYADSRDNIYYFDRSKKVKPFFKNKEYYIPRIMVKDDLLFTVVEEAATKKWKILIAQNGEIIKEKVFDKNYFPNEVYMLSGIDDGLCVSTSRGIYIFDKDLNLEYHYLEEERITDALYDREGNLWLTSLQNGIYVIPSLELKIYAENFFPDVNITTMAVRNDKVVVATYLSNIYEFNPTDDTYQVLDIPKHKRFKYSKKLIEDDRYQVYALGGNTVLKDKKTPTAAVRVLNINNVRDLVVKGDSLFCTTTFGFCAYDLKTDKRRQINKIGGRAIAKDKNGEIYFSDKIGFYKYQNGRIEEIKKDKESVFPMCMDWQGDTLWLGTLNDGILAFHDGKFVKHLYRNQGNPNNMVRSIKVYKNWLLASTDIGLIRLDLENDQMEIINRADGLHQNEIMSIEVLNDEVYLATTVGMIRFPLSIQAKNIVFPNITLHAIVVNDSLEVSFAKKKFRHNENNILFNFQTALFRSRKSFQYEYRLKGLSNKWQKTKATEPFAQYRSLPSGRYIFEVRAINEDGARSKTETFNFSVSAPIWLRWWFILFVFSFMAVLTYFFVNRRIRRIKRQARIENELKTSQLTALKAQMNPHFLYNALNSIQDLILQKDVKNAVRYLTKFSHLMRQILDASGMTSISLGDEIKILQLYLDLEKLRFGDDFQYEIRVDSNIDEEFMKIPSMIIQPFVENAVKHGLLHKTKGIKRLILDFKKEDLLVCTVKDNGVGRAKAAQIQERQGKNRTSFATSATQKRLDILNQTYQQKIGIEIFDLMEDKEASGTKVLLRIPFRG